MSVSKVQMSVNTLTMDPTFKLLTSGCSNSEGTGWLDWFLPLQQQAKLYITCSFCHRTHNFEDADLCLFCCTDSKVSASSKKHEDASYKMQVINTTYRHVMVTLWNCMGLMRQIAARSTKNFNFADVGESTNVDKPAVEEEDTEVDELADIDAQGGEESDLSLTETEDDTERRIIGSSKSPHSCRSSTVANEPLNATSNSSKFIFDSLLSLIVLVQIFFNC